MNLAQTCFFLAHSNNTISVYIQEKFHAKIENLSVIEDGVSFGDFQSGPFHIT